MDIIKLAADALAPIAQEGIVVQQGWYDKNINDTHREIERSMTWCLFLFLGKSPGTAKEVEETEAVTIVVPGWVWAFVALIPTTVMGLIAWHYKRRVEKAEAEEEKRENNKEQFLFMSAV